MTASSRIVLTIVGLTLATLGILGVAAIDTRAEIGQGSAKAVSQTLKSMGANNILIMPGTASTGGVSFGGGSVMTLTPQDAEAITRECPAVNSVATVVRARTQVITGEGRATAKGDGSANPFVPSPFGGKKQ